MSDDQKTVGSVELNASTKLVFSIERWKGRSFAQVRKFVATARYDGPTASGFSMNEAVASGLVAELTKLKMNGPVPGQEICAVIAKNRSAKIRIAIVPPDTTDALPVLDLREFVENETYIGPTKKGIRFPWDKLSEVIACIEVQVHSLGARAASGSPIFPDVQPPLVSQPKPRIAEDLPKNALSHLIPQPLKSFPADFLRAGETVGTMLTLPTTPLQIWHKPDGKIYIVSPSGFEYCVRNEVEARYLIYAQQRGVTEVLVPEKMISIFTAVATYEKYARELRQKLTKAFLSQSHNRQLAEYQSSDLLKAFALPVL